MEPEIDKIETSQTPVIPSPHHSILHKKLLFILLGFVILLGLSASGGYYLGKKQIYPTALQTNTYPSPTSLITPQITNAGIVETEIFNELGIRFNLETIQQNQTYHAVRIQNQVFIGTSLDTERDQAIYVLTKAPSQTFAEAVRTELGIHNDNCYLKTSGFIHQLNFPKNFQIGQLNYRGPDGKDAYFSSGIGLVPPETATNCVPDFMTLDDGRYFLYDPNYPEKFFFVKIGQSPIYGDAAETKLWADTLQITNHNQYKAPQTFFPTK